MANIPINIRSFIRSILRSIAFYPALITVGYIVLALLMLSAEGQGITAWVRERLPILIIQDADTGRAILTTLIAATISLTVFSFSMVMVVLNQAASNYTPRLLPRLISNKRHQIVLGTYIGSICFYLIALLSILPDAKEWQIPGFTIFFAVLLGISCICLFVYFIHGISESIQIDHIVASIYQRTSNRLEQEQELSSERIKHDIPDTQDWRTINNHKTGYFVDIDFSALAKISESKKGEIRFLVPFGTFVLPNIPIVCCNWSVNEEDEERIHKQINIEPDHPGEDSKQGFKHMTEVAVKAMSPGINDPGTALSAIDYLSALLHERLKTIEHNCFKSDEGGIVYYHEPSFSDVLSEVMSSLRLYCKHDTIVVKKLLSMLHFLYLQCNENFLHQKESIYQEANALIEDIKKTIENKLDRSVIVDVIEHINLDFSEDNQLALD